MAVRIESHAEPIPGYRLIERLGGGGFGEVWKCEAPGGLQKAIKFVFGDLASADNEEGARAEQELKALKRVQTVRHPYILSLERYDIIDGQLLIVMELADRSLWDRYRECRAEGLRGIPRDELIRYMEETAEALDLMNSLYQLQHLDIKPQNLFLVHNHVKVADFGLVKDLEGTTASVTGGVTPVYAAPETFDGKVTRFSDQYSLGIVYQELLTGQRPFNGTTLRQLVMQHLQQPPDLTSLAPADRAAVGKALAKASDDRYPTCIEFVMALRRASGEANASPVSPPLNYTPAPLPSPLPEPALDSGEKTQNTAPQRTVLPPPLPGAPPLTPHYGSTQTDTGTTPPPSGEFPRPSLARLAKVPLPTRGDSATPLPATRRAPVPDSPDGVLIPALVVGLGRMGLQVLRQLRQEVVEQYGTADALPHLRLLHIDSDPDTAAAAPRGAPNAALRPSETLVARLHRPSHYFKSRDAVTELETWMFPKMLYRMQRQQTASGLRALGRLAFLDNYRPIARRLEAELQECYRPEALHHAVQASGLSARSGSPRVYVVSGLAGGTGSGMLLDLAYTAGHVLESLGVERPEVIGVLMLPAVDADPARTPEMANTFAALTELNHFASPAAVFHAHYETGDPTFPKIFTRRGPPFRRCFFVPLPEIRPGLTPLAEADGDLPALPRPTARALATAGHFVFSDLLSPLGRAADQAREQATEVAARARPEVASGTLFQTVGMYRILWPRRRVLERAGRTLCRKLVQRWMTKDAKPLREPLRGWVAKQWEELSLGQDKLIQRLQHCVALALKQQPEVAVAAIAAPAQQSLMPAAQGKGDVALKLGAIVEAMEGFEQLLGIPEELRSDAVRAGEPPTPGAVETALAAAADQFADEYEQKLSEVVVRLIEEPHYRLAGAEEAMRQLGECVEQALRHHEELTKELHERAVAAYIKLQQAIDHPAPSQSQSSLWRAPFTRRVQQPNTVFAQELIELLRSYPKCRYQSLVLQRVGALYVGLRGQLSDQLREVDYCRARLGELREQLSAPPSPATPAPAGPAAGRFLFPVGCQTIDEAVTWLEEWVTAERLLDVDRRMQALLRRQFRALVNVCMSPSNLLRTLVPAMQDEAEKFLTPALGTSDVAHMYLEQHQHAEGGRPKDETATDALRLDLLAAFHKAAPELRAGPQGEETFILAVPACSSGQEFRDLLRLSLPTLRPAEAGAADEIVLYRELNCIALGDLDQLGPAGLEAYRRVTAQEAFTPHARIDLAWRGTVAAT